MSRCNFQIPISNVLAGGKRGKVMIRVQLPRQSYVATIEKGICTGVSRKGSAAAQHRVLGSYQAACS